MENAMLIQPGAVLNDRYTINSVLGAGGFGITYKAYDGLLNTWIAIKEYFPSGVACRSSSDNTVILYTQNERSDYLHGMQKFMDEARKLVRFNKNPNIVSVYDFFECNNTAYMVMEYLDGENLRDYFKKAQSVADEAMTLQIAFSVMDALEAVHSVGLIHRDVSPDNIFICRDKTIKLIDFGEAKLSVGAENKTHTIVLKHGFAPPEQYMSKGIQGPWTDIYAFGATLYRIMTEKTPIDSTSRMMEDTLIPCNRINPNIPAYICKVIDKAMSINATRRYRTIAEMRKDFLREKIADDVKKKEPNRIRQILGIIAFWCVFFLLVIFLILFS